MLVNPHPLYKGGQAGLAGDRAGGLAAGISRYLVHSPSTRWGGGSQHHGNSQQDTAPGETPQTSGTDLPQVALGCPGHWDRGCVSMRPRAGDE